MGRQLNFYLTPKDLAALQEALESKLPMSYLAYRSSNAAPQLLPSLEIARMGEDSLVVYLVQPHRLSGVHLHEVAKQGYWTIDVLRSPVVQLSRCYFNGEILRRGRLFFYPQYY